MITAIVMVSVETDKIPEVADFAGWPGKILDMEGDWYVKQDR